MKSIPNFWDLREGVAECRAAYSEARARHDGLAREIKARTDRLAAIAKERTAWAERAKNADEHIATLAERAGEADKELQEMADLPQMWQARRDKLFAALAQAEERRKLAADALSQAEAKLSACESEARKAQDTLSETRENRARIEARLEAARERLAEMAARIAEVLHCKPEQVLDHTGLAENAKMPAIEDIERKLERYRAERERLGGVNLRAEEEAAELTEQLTGLTTERDDLISAIHRLRQGIASLNKEGRERLLAAFDTVNENFSRLFTHLFNGGKAELQLTESDDPLDAGLEIMARPPGKRPQVLSLLVRWRAGADDDVADLRGVPDQPVADLRARRGRRAAGRCQCGAVLQPARRDDADDRYAVPGDHAPCLFDGADEPVVRCHHG